MIFRSFDDQLTALDADSKKIGTPRRLIWTSLCWSTDSRRVVEHGITIDVAYSIFSH